MLKLVVARLRALFAAMDVGTESVPIKIKLIAPPMCVLSTTTLDKEIGMNLLTKAMQVIQDRITAKGGKLDAKMEPRAASAREETELQAMMDR